MQNTSLASRYRPQTFAEVAGQDMVKAVLSRAAAEDKVAPAYLFSGTRGVGKTTIARIFAKALNCTHAPSADPCNCCEQCRKITQGIHVDVTEIDGASNNSVEDARALREKIGYAPMEGRYKVFIIDEAHMLSRSAFNALLKTLEEPPARVVFIFATTEAHKFPITIVSRCQHFIFRHLPESALITHLSTVLQKEHVPFEESAVRLIAKRAAGSVRDGMSLLDQTLALGGTNLTQESAREVLGLAGQDMFIALLDHLATQDCASVSLLLRRLLEQGIDIGFFLRELAHIWRTLFLLRQSGDKALPVLELPDDEAHLWQTQAPRFSLAHIHAAWQMVLDTQRRIIQSPEPAAALELLLLHIALLPRLLPLDRLPDAAQNMPSGTPTSANPGTNTSIQPSIPPQAQAGLAHTNHTPHNTNAQAAAISHATTAHKAMLHTKHSEKKDSTPTPTTSEAPTQDEEPELPVELRSWPDFCAFCLREQEQGRNMPLPSRLLSQASVQFATNSCRIQPKTDILYKLLIKNSGILSQLMSAYCGGHIDVSLIKPVHSQKTQTQLIEEFNQRKEIQQCCEMLDAKLVHCQLVK